MAIIQPVEVNGHYNSDLTLSYSRPLAVCIAHGMVSHRVGPKVSFIDYRDIIPIMRN